jgi:hypothetical protein
MSITKIVDHFIDTDLTGSQIKEIINKTPVLYSTIPKYTFNTLFPPSSPFQIFLLQTTNVNTGHYVAVIVNKKKIEYFDPYGLGSPDSYKQYTKFDQQYGSLLLNLLNSDPLKRPIISNKIDYQTRNNNVSTCGRWSCSRIMYRNLSQVQFAGLFSGNGGVLKDKDFLITLLTLNSMDNIPEYFDTLTS